MRALQAAACALVLGTLSPTAAHAETAVRHATVNVDGVDVFYREAGHSNARAVLLLHGFPSSSFMFRELLPKLADRWRVVAPDYPGFGASDFPSPERYEYSFANLTRSMERFTEVLGLDRYAIYIQDYGAPIGLRLALRRPERITALIVQNGNAYAEGLSAAWDPLEAYWSAPTGETREQLRGWLTESGIREQYVAGVPAELLERFSPDTWTLDWARLNRPGNIDMQLQLFGDYRTNVELYPRFQALFRDRQWPTLVVWGRHDPFFTEEGAAAYGRDLPAAEIHLLSAGHFALETHAPEIAALMREFLDRHEVGRHAASGADNH